MTASAISAQAVITCEFFGHAEFSNGQTDAVIMTDAYSAGLPFKGVLAGYLESGQWEVETCRYDRRIGAYEAYLRSLAGDAVVWLRSQLNAPAPC